MSGVSPKLLYSARVTLAEPATLIGIVLALFFAYLIAAPVLAMLVDAVVVQVPDARRIGAEPGTFTLYYLERALFSRVADPVFWTPLRNTLTIAFGEIGRAHV